MSVYRKEPERPLMSEERLAHLERCEVILDALEERAAWVNVSGSTRKDRWHVELHTGEVSDVYPVFAEGEGRTLREAVEDALSCPSAPIRPMALGRGRLGLGDALFTVILGFVAGAFIF